MDKGTYLPRLFAACGFALLLAGGREGEGGESRVKSKGRMVECGAPASAPNEQTNKRKLAEDLHYLKHDPYRWVSLDGAPATLPDLQHATGIDYSTLPYFSITTAPACGGLA